MGKEELWERQVCGRDRCVEGKSVERTGMREGKQRKRKRCGREKSERDRCVGETGVEKRDVGVKNVEERCVARTDVEGRFVGKDRCVRSKVYTCI